MPLYSMNLSDTIIDLSISLSLIQRFLLVFRLVSAIEQPHRSIRKVRWTVHCTPQFSSHQRRPSGLPQRFRFRSTITTITKTTATTTTATLSGPPSQRLSSHRHRNSAIPASSVRQHMRRCSAVNRARRKFNGAPFLLTRMRRTIITIRWVRHSKEPQHINRHDPAAHNRITITISNRCHNISSNGSIDPSHVALNIPPQHRRHPYTTDTAATTQTLCTPWNVASRFDTFRRHFSRSLSPLPDQRSAAQLRNPQRPCRRCTVRWRCQWIRALRAAVWPIIVSIAMITKRIRGIIAFILFDLKMV